MNKRKISILHVCCTTDDQANGMVQVIPEHVKAQSKYINVALLNLSDYRYKLPNDLKSYNYSDYVKAGFNEIIKSLEDILIVVFHGIYLPRIICFWYTNIRNTYPYIIIPHGSMTYQIQQRRKLKKKVFNRLFISLFSKQALAIHFLSEDEKEESLKCFKVNPIVLPNGIKSSKLSLNTKNRLQKLNIKILYIGRYDKYHKGLDILLEACKHLQNVLRENNVQIVMYGPVENSDYTWTKEYINNYNLNDFITCNDAIYGEEKISQLLDCDFFIQTSRLEGLPMSLLEAFSLGIPVLITEGTNLGKDIRENKNGSVQETTVEGVCALLRFAIKNKKNIAALSKASINASKRYEWDKVANETINMYEELVSLYQEG